MMLKITPDKERAKSIIKMAEKRELMISRLLSEDDALTFAAENYYEVINELITAILLCEGIKIIGENAHKESIDFLKRYQEFGEGEIIFLNDLRNKRNKSRYEGKQFENTYLASHQLKIEELLSKLKKIITDKISI